MNIRIFNIEKDKDIGGPGNRMRIFFQGCLKKCEGCKAEKSWPLNGGDKMDTSEITKLISADPELKGITLTGGEPFLQPAQALILATFAKGKGLNVWCYTGYTFEEIIQWQDNRKLLLQKIDVLVDGPFEKDKFSLDVPWRGSTNQRLVDVAKSLEKGKVVEYGG